MYECSKLEKWISHKVIGMRDHCRRGYLFSFLLAAMLSSNAYSYATTINDQVPMMGNFALPSSQQPGAFLSIGQNTLEKGKTQLYIGGADFAGQDQHFIEVIPGIVYGLTQQLSVFLNVPIAANYQQASYHSSGLGDVSLQLEYAFYNDATNRYQDTATLVANTSFPTGSDKKNPATGNGSETYFLGATFSRLYMDWLLFTSPGISVTTTHDGTKFGNSFLYQFGLGKNIAYATSQYIFSWLLELDGTYSQKDRINGVTNPDSGGNIVYATPSLWFSTQHLILQAGAGKPIIQSLNGSQPKNTYLIAFNVGWTFF